jgi:hypothetical protein
MQLREALLVQGPSLALQRAASDEIARLDARVRALEALVEGVTYGLSDAGSPPRFDAEHRVPDVERRRR